MLTQYSEFKTTTLFQQVHFFLIFLSSDFRFSRIITDSIYLSYFSFEEKIEGALKAAVKKKLSESKNHQTYLLKLVFLTTLKNVQYRIWQQCSELAPCPEDRTQFD